MCQPMFRCPSHTFFEALDKKAKQEVDEAVEIAKASPEPSMEDFWADVYYKGTEPPFMRGREREEVHYY